MVEWHSLDGCYGEYHEQLKVTETMNIFVIFKTIGSFLWKGKTFLFGGLIYLLGRKAARKNDQLKTQASLIKGDEEILQTIQQMQQAGNNSPGNKEELLDVLGKGQF